MEPVKCCICWERLGTNGGPVSLPCGHNGCLICLKNCQRRPPRACPQCRTSLRGLTLCVNPELRSLLDLAARLQGTSISPRARSPARPPAPVTPSQQGEAASSLHGSVAQQEADSHSDALLGEGYEGNQQNEVDHAFNMGESLELLSDVYTKVCGAASTAAAGMQQTSWNGHGDAATR
ncbi:hypothetical protein WJX72_000117 [[Myrmecia] bisecta]|uniref:RING-type domain-containing protein n=1 Tax=[Myrmecia] bisecta TaxID=41462 RepID=A0AAW1Q309_9CHLO